MRRLPFVLALAAAVPLAAQSPAGTAPGAPRRDTIAVLLVTATHPWLGGDGRIADVQALVRDAIGTGDAPRATGWVARGVAVPAVRATLAAIVESPESDDAERADARSLDSVAVASTARALDDTDAALLGLGLHVVVARHASRHAQGRIDPTRVHAEWSLAPEPIDLAALVTTLQRDGTQPAALFAQLQPTTPHYRRLLLARDALRTLRADSVPAALPVPKRAVKLGQKAPGLRALARALVALGELAPDARVDTLRYAAPLADAVLRAKRRANPKATTLLDASVAPLLVTQLAERETGLALAIERWRWLPRAFAASPLVVNIPEYRLERWGEWAGDTASGGLAMNVVVGRADSNATPVFASSMTQVVFSPQWRVPMSIMKKEIGPAAQRNAGYLRRHNYYLVTAKGDELPMTAANIARIGQGVWVRQRSGGGNSLGRVKFNMYNPYDIYLHDTPAKRFFARARRDLSHGCVRLADPTALAKFVLADNPTWTDERIGEAMGAGKEKYVGLKKSIPVLLLYHTLVVEPDGTLRRFDDIYGHDARTVAALHGERTAPAPVVEEAAP
jgi:murein L,D-transpeptidase YcbB/YkuD